MNKEQVIELFLQSRIFQQWHWFTYHFTFYLRQIEHPFARSIVKACVDVDAKIPGFAAEFVTRLASVGGREKNLGDYQQLLSQLAELLVLRQVVTYAWPCEDLAFEYEPSGLGSRKNPELVVTCAGVRFGIEVKAPALLDHEEKRAENPVQLPSRAASREIARVMARGEEATLPRDNPVKDFLLSAESKFAPFHQEQASFYGILVIVWDDYIYEPISALLGHAAGLFTGNSFATSDDGQPYTFPHVDAVILIRHLHILKLAAGEQPLMDAAHAMDYGQENRFPFKAYVQNPVGRPLPEEVLRCFQAVPPTAMLGAEYLPSDTIWWVKTRGTE